MAKGGEMEMLAQLAEADLQHVSVGTRATVTPVGSNLEIAGQVWQKSPVINPDTRQGIVRSEEHTSELQSLMRISYAVFCLKKKKTSKSTTTTNRQVRL